MRDVVSNLPLRDLRVLELPFHGISDEKILLCSASLIGHTDLRVTLRAASSIVTKTSHVVILIAATDVRSGLNVSRSEVVVILDIVMLWDRKMVDILVLVREVIVLETQILEVESGGDEGTDVGQLARIIKGIVVVQSVAAAP